MCVVGQGTDISSAWNSFPSLFSQLPPLYLPTFMPKQTLWGALLGTPV